MFTERDIREAVTEQIFHRGNLLESTGGVHNFERRNTMSEYGDPELYVSATVKGSSQSSYQVEAMIDEEYGESYDEYCECPAFLKYDGICKHCVALLLHYIHERDHEAVCEKMISVKDAPAKKRRTDWGFGYILGKFAKQEALVYSERSSWRQVHLEPVLHIEYHEVEVSLRIGMEKMYVVKDIFELCQNVRNISEHSYGAKLTLVHYPDMFDDQSRPIMEFFMRRFEGVKWCESAIRRYPLKTDELDEFLNLTGYHGVLVKFSEGNQEMMTLTEEPFKRNLSIIGKEGGIALKLSKDTTIQTRNWNYVFQKQTIYRIDRCSQQQANEFETYMDTYVNEECFVAEEDLPVFAREMLPVLGQAYRVHKENFSVEQYLPEEVRFQLYLDMPQRDLITCDLVADYGEDRKYHVFEGIHQKENRDIRKEAGAAAVVYGYCNAFDSVNHIPVASEDDGCIYRLLTEGVEAFYKIAEVFISDRLKRIRMVQIPKVHVGVSLNGNLLELTVESEEMDLEQLASILSRYDRRKKFYRLKSGEFISMEDDNLETLAEMKKGLRLSDDMFARGKITLPKYRALYLDAQFRANESLPVDRSRDFKTLIRNMKTIEDSEYEVPVALEKTLCGYQKKGYLWLETLYANGFGGILADEMGLGKTLQVITFLYSHYIEKGDTGKNTLIVCPASLVYNWEHECRKFAPELSVRTVVGSAAQRTKILKACKERTILITSYELLKRDLSDYEQIDFAFQIIDEAQYIKNANTLAAKSVKEIRSDFRLALTGTPVENRLSELWSIFDYLMPGCLYTYQRFREEIELPVVQRQDEETLARLRKMIAPFILRRLKKDVLKELPDKLEKNMFARMEGEQKELYQAHVQRMQMFLSRQTPEEFDKSKIQILAELTRLRQLCCDPALLYENYVSGSAKLELCIEMVENAVEAGHKILIFSQFTTMLDRIAGELEKKHLSFYMLTGATQKLERMHMVNAFNQDTVPVFLISLKAGGTGLNLTAADVVIHYDPWWNTAVQNQATDRAHRIGQKNTVVVYKLIAKDTIEESIVKLQEQKQELAEQVLGGEGVQRPTFTREALQELLRF